MAGETKSYLRQSDDVYSAFKIGAHRDTIRAIRDRRRTAPICMQIDLASSCFHNCQFCCYRSSGFDTPHQGGTMQFDDKKNLPADLALRVIRECAELGVKAIELTGGGSPTIVPYFKDAVREIAACGMELAVVTNGERFTPDVTDIIPENLIRWIRFSMDAATEETHTKVHYSGDERFARKPRRTFNDIIIPNLAYIASMKRTWHPDFRLGVSYVIVPENIGEIDVAAALFKRLGVDNIRYSFEYDINYDGGLTEEQKQEAYVRMERAKHSFDDGKFRVFGWKSRLDEYKAENDFDFCSYQFGTMQIGADGGVWPCCIVKYYPEHSLGNVHNQSLREILLGEQRQVDFDVRGCPPCWLKSKNELGNALADGSVREFLAPIKFNEFEEYMKRTNKPHVNFP